VRYDCGDKQKRDRAISPTRSEPRKNPILRQGVGAGGGRVVQAGKPWLSLPRSWLFAPR
jgi:hypothetical protein